VLEVNLSNRNPTKHSNLVKRFVQHSGNRSLLNKDIGKIKGTVRMQIEPEALATVRPKLTSSPKEPSYGGTIWAGKTVANASGSERIKGKPSQND